MIPIVEDYLSELIENKLLYLKNNPNYIDKILATSPDKLSRLKEFVQTKPVRVVRGYPRDAAVLPAICILLSEEEEAQDGLGDYGEDEDLSYNEFTETLTVIDTIGSKVPLPYVETTYKPLEGVSQIIHDDYGVILPPTEYAINNNDLGIVGLYSSSLEHGDLVTVTYVYKATTQEANEVMYESNYRLEVWTENGDLTVELYHLLKWMLLSGRDSLIPNYDIFRQKLSGADFEPVPNYFPTFVYRRALKFWCQFVVSTPGEESQYITGMETNQTNYLDTFYGGED